MVFATIKTKVSDWFNSFPYPIRIPVPIVSAQALELAELDVVTARWLIKTQQTSDEQVCLHGKLATFHGLKQLERVTDELREHNWYVLDRTSIATYQKLATKISLLSRFGYRFKQVFFTFERKLRHRGWIGGISAVIGFFLTIPLSFVAAFGIVPEFFQAVLFIQLAAATSLYAGWKMPALPNKSTKEQEVADGFEEFFFAAGKPHATLNFVLFFLAPTVVLSLLWAIVSSPFKASLAKLRRWEEIPLRAFEGELPQNVQDVAYGLGKELPDLSFSLEVRRDDLRNPPVMSDDPFFICRYGQRPGDKLYLWHELAA